MFWESRGGYEYEVDENGQYTGWYRCSGGRMSDGRWPAWRNGATRYDM